MKTSSYPRLYDKLSPRGVEVAASVARECGVDAKVGKEHLPSGDTAVAIKFKKLTSGTESWGAVDKLAAAGFAPDVLSNGYWHECSAAFVDGAVFDKFLARSV